MLSPAFFCAPANVLRLHLLVTFGVRRAVFVQSGLVIGPFGIRRLPEDYVLVQTVHTPFKVVLSQCMNCLALVRALPGPVPARVKTPTLP